jgi:hypothetical protein
MIGSALTFNHDHHTTVFMLTIPSLCYRFSHEKKANNNTEKKNSSMWLKNH